MSLQSNSHDLILDISGDGFVLGGFILGGGFAKALDEFVLDRLVS